jgi:hypothetical protein
MTAVTDTLQYAYALKRVKIGHFQDRVHNANILSSIALVMSTVNKQSLSIL